MVSNQLIDNQLKSNQNLLRSMIREILNTPEQYCLMEICGTHTLAFSETGIRELIKPKIHLLSGPGCPVCVTSEEYIDSAIALARYPNVVLATFGDLMRIKGSTEDLMTIKERGKEVRVLYSPLDCINLAKDCTDKEIIFLGVGFETTAPLIALAIKKAKELGIKNCSFLLGLKRMEPVLHYILRDPTHKIQGMICPGHVAAVTGAGYFRFITNQYHIPAVIAGFEEVDLLGAVYFLTVNQRIMDKKFENQYRTCVNEFGNHFAKNLMEEVFDACDSDGEELV